MLRRIARTARPVWRVVRNPAAHNAQLPGGFQRIYHFHVRKSGGTSLNQTFLELRGGNGEAVYRNLARSPDLRLVGDWTVVGWDRRLLSAGRYCYGFSHCPQHQLDLPPATFRVTILRDPVDRVLSLHNMLTDMQADGSTHPAFREEQHWLGDRFTDFLDRVPRHHLLNQLWMFSDELNVDEAVTRLSELEAVLRTETLGSGLVALSEQLDLNVRPRHVRRSQQRSHQGLDRLREMVALEYELLDKAAEVVPDPTSRGESIKSTGGS